MLREHFGSRFGNLWMTSFHVPDESDQRLVVAVVEPTDADQAYLGSLPYVGGRTDLASAQYSEAQLQGFRDELTKLVLAPSPSSEPSVWGVGIGVRDGNVTALGQPTVVVLATSCEPTVLASLAAAVPADAVQVEVMAKFHFN